MSTHDASSGSTAGQLKRSVGFYGLMFVSLGSIIGSGWLLGALGEVEAAFEVVARAEEECLAYLYFTGLPGFDPLRGDPRFAALQTRLGLTA